MLVVRLFLVASLFAVGGCALATNGTTQSLRVESAPPGATAKMAGVTMHTPAVIVVSRRPSYYVLRMEAPGYAPMCELVEGDKRGAALIVDSIPAAIPLAIDAMAGALHTYPDPLQVELQPLPPGATPAGFPRDEDILSEYEDHGHNLCLPANLQTLPPEQQVTREGAEEGARFQKLIATDGPINQAYDILGQVDVDTTDRNAFKRNMKDFFGRGWLVVAFTGPTPKGTDEEMIGELKWKALSLYGDKVNALINVGTHTDRDGEVFAHGLAVRFTSSQASENSGHEAAMTVEERLRRLDRLHDEGAISKPEYERKRRELIDAL